MRNTIYLLVFTLSFSLSSLNLHSQWVSIPDTNFGNWLNTNGYDQCLQGNSTTGWQMDTTCNAVVNATDIDCYNQGIEDITGIEYFDGLLNLQCVGNSLYVYGLPILPSTLVTLNCSSNQLSSLPTLPQNLSTLNCDHNSLTFLPVLPSTLQTLTCSFNQLTSLPSLPLGLLSLSCGYNPGLTFFPTLPATLNSFSCAGNGLINLPFLPSALVGLYCQDNQISSLSFLPNSLKTITSQNNQLSVLPELPDSLYTLNISNNPITCLPQIKFIGNFSFNNTLITCLPNYGEVLYPNPSLSFYPLCDTFNSNGCSILWNITGNTYFDVNANCQKNTNDTALKNLPVQLWSNGNQIQQVFSNPNGQYTLDTKVLGTYNVVMDTSKIPFYVICPSNGLWVDTISLQDSISYNRDFALACKSGFDLKAQSITASIFRPANNTTVNITAGDASNFYNANCAAGISGSVTLTYTGPVQFVSAAPNALTPTVSGNTLTWNIADFGNINFFTAFNIVMLTDTNAQIGQQACFTLTVNPIAGDNNPANNTLTICFPVVNSYDPNDKTAYPAGDIDTAQKELTYTIRFQNTGTAEAQHIYITDTLDADVDASSFQLLAYSHQPMVQLKENALRFNFPNINLPDSNTNEPASHGYVQYKVKLKPNLPIGTVINNTAYIYFDFNAPVVTNTTTNTISLLSSIGHSSLATPHFTLYPNPTNNSVTISIPENLIGSTATISDITGRVVFKSEITNPKSEINLAGFSSGVYFVTVLSANGAGTVKRLVKE